MRIVFFGTPSTAVPSLEAMLDAGYRPSLVVTQPDRRKGRRLSPVAPPVKRAAIEQGLDLIQPEKVRTRGFRERLAASAPDLLVVVAFGRILSPRVLGLARHGGINVHFSLLPRYRGAAPVQWALARGESLTGVTTMLMNDRMDEGDILLVREVAIEPGEHAPSLQERLSRIGAELLVETLDALRADRLEPRPQDHSAATLAPLLERDHGNIDVGLQAREIEGRIRGFDPWPGVWLARGGRRVRLVDARALDEKPVTAPPGSLLELRDEGMVMACGDGTALLVFQVQPEGRRVLGVRDAVNGRQLAVGDRLERISGTD